MPPDPHPPRPGTDTPWGKAQTVTREETGIHAVTTASHGGLWLSPERAAALPDSFRPFTGDRQWIEEDVDAHLVAWFFDLPAADLGTCQSLGGRLPGAARNLETLQAARPHPSTILSPSTSSGQA